jgi:hypothetical protein
MSYVYAYTVNGTLWYIGKGSGVRDKRHLQRAKRYAAGYLLHRIRRWQIELAEALQNDAEVVIERLYEGSEDEALRIERELIATRRPLKNTLPGGEGGRLRRPADRQMQQTIKSGDCK